MPHRAWGRRCCKLKMGEDGIAPTILDPDVRNSSECKSFNVEKSSPEASKYCCWLFGLLVETVGVQPWSL